MDYLKLAKETIAKLAGTNIVQLESEKREISEKRLKSTKATDIRFTSETDPYKTIGARNYWKNHVPANQRPRWAKEVYGLE